MSHKLTEPFSILVFDTDEENKVEFINIGTPLDYTFYGVSFEDCLDVGSYYNTKYSSLEEIKEKEYLEYRNNLEKTKKELLEEGYYEKTQDLAILYQHYAKIYFEEKEKMKGHYKKFSKSQTAKNFNNFFKEHQGLNEGNKGCLDQRFHLGSYIKKEILNGKECSVIDCKENKIFTKEEYIKSVEDSCFNCLKAYEDNLNYGKTIMKEDYDDLIKTVKKLLKQHRRVGLIGYNTTGHVKEINNLSIDEFKIIDYLKVKPHYIYWFTN